MRREGLARRLLVAASAFVLAGLAGTALWYLDADTRVPLHPKLRSVNVYPYRSGKGQGLLVQDPQAYGREALVLSDDAAPMLGLMDGTRTTAEIAAEMRRRTADPEAWDGARTLVEKLHEEYFLEGPRFEKRRAEVDGAFRRLPFRPAAHAGGPYPRDAGAVRIALDSYFRKAGRSAATARRRTTRALVVPHVDPRRGGVAQSAGYLALAGGPPPEVFVLFGTAHAGCAEPMAFTGKDFDTPLGRVLTDRPLVERLASAYGPAAFDDEPAHRREHSLELTVLFLQYAFASAALRIVPVLCGPLDPQGKDAASERKVSAVAAEVSRIVSEHPAGRVCLIAAADLSHVGRRFGDPEPDRRALAAVERYDRSLLSAAASGDAEAFRRRIAEVSDRYRVCGWAPTYALLRCGTFRAGEILRYEQAREKETGSVVTYAALALRSAPDR